MIATTRAALLRSIDSENDLGDTVSVDAVVEGFGDFPASVIETSRREQDPATGIWRTVRVYTGRVPSNVPVVAGDKLRDRDGVIYIVDEFERMKRGLSGRASVTLSMRRTAP